MAMIRGGLPTVPPAWALLQRQLLGAMGAAGEAFVARYTHPDGSLIWRESWPGMDGSDDGYESFGNFALYYALGGAERYLRLARDEWEAVTRQFSAYGQVHREFDAYYDWMHHGESYTYLYFLGLADPSDTAFRERARRFAAMYTGDDPEAPNYDPQRRLIRSPINGSRGPRFENSALDWVTHRPVLAGYPPPFEDIPGAPGPLCDWNDDTIFGEVLTRLNARMMRGDVPLNLSSTSLMTHAFLLTGEARYRDWVLDYTAAWRDRAASNGGLIPDNVGLSGEIGECLDGKWYGGYYGYRWPHGIMTVLEPVMIAAANCLLLSGDWSWLDFPRGQLDRLVAQGQRRDGLLLVPHRHGDAGWYDFRPLHPRFHTYLWYLSQDPADWERLTALGPRDDWDTVHGRRGKCDQEHAGCWVRYLEGRLPAYPELILRANYTEMLRRLALIDADHTTVDGQDVHHWQERNPVSTEALVHLTLGGPQFIYHGGLLHVRLRYFDPANQRAGLPPDVAALVERVAADETTVCLHNLDPLARRTVILRAGAFGEHRFGQVAPEGGEPVAVNASWLEVELAPGAALRLNLAMERYVATPTYRQPWARVEA
ncbi:MAG: hypothetical protein HUU35_03720 [Armatimonadetes bacterium]|nr:hypothetical protein [Armatimonadota bacterium]